MQEVSNSSLKITLLGISCTECTCSYTCVFFSPLSVIVPPDLQVRQAHTKSSAKTTAEGQIDSSLELSDTVSIDSDDSDPKPKPQDTESEYGKKVEGTCAKIGRALLEAIDAVSEWLESTSALYREVVAELRKQQEASTEQYLFAGSADSYGSSADRKDSLRKPHATPGAEASHVPPGLDRVTEEVLVEVHTESERRSPDSSKAAMQHGGIPEEDETVDADQHPEMGGATPLSPVEKFGDASLRGRKSKDQKTVAFDERGDALIDALHLAPSDKQQEQLEDFETEFEEQTMQYSKRLKRLLTAFLYAFRAHSEYIAYFFVILDVVLNGSVLSLVYAFLLFAWGLLSIPWPSRKFWLTMIFYTMVVLVVKYAFQFYDIPYWMDHFKEDSGLYPPRIIGILFQPNFFTNVVWDLLLLISLLVHSELLKVRASVCSYFSMFLSLYKAICLHSIIMGSF